LRQSFFVILSVSQRLLLFITDGAKEMAKAIAKGNNISELRDAIEMVVRMLANKGIKVTQSGIQAFVSYDKTTLEPERVNIPMISEKSSPELVIAIKGFVDHEVGHLLFTDPKIIKRAVEEKVGNLHNIFEDTFIEAQMKKAFAGSTRNIDKTVEFAIKHFFQKSFDEALKARQSNPEMSEAKFFIAGLVVPAIRAMAGQEAAMEFMADKWVHIENVYAELKLLEPQIVGINSSLKALQMANTFRDILCEVDQRERDERAKAAEEAARADGDDGDDGDDGSDSSSSSSSSSSGAPEDRRSMGDDIFNPEEGDESQASGSSGDSKSSKSKPKSSPKPEEDGPEDEDKPDEGGSEAEDEPEEGDSDGKGSSGEEGEEDEADQEGEGAGDGSGEGDSEEEEAEGESGGTGGEETESDSSGGDKESEKSTDFEGGDGGERLGDDGEERNRDTSGWHGGATTRSAGEREDLSLLKDIEEVDTYDSALENALTEGALQSLQDRSYMAFSNENDKIETYSVPDNRMREVNERRNRLRQENSERIGVMAKALERIIAARNRSTYVPGFKSGRLHSSSLYKLKTGDNRVFRRQEVSRTKDTAVMLLVDCSGSMSNRNRIYKAAEAAYALATSLERINVKTQVMGFTTIENYAFFSEARDQLAELAATRPDFKGGFDRVSPLFMPIFKTFDERMTPECETRIAGLPTVDMANNADSESVEIAANILAARREERKILVVLSDGQPAQQRLYTYEERADRAKQHLHHVVDRVEKAGIEILGIGIEADAVNEYYPKSIVLDNVAELPTKIVSEMTSMLLK